MSENILGVYGAYVAENEEKLVSLTPETSSPSSSSEVIITPPNPLSLLTPTPAARITPTSAVSASTALTSAVVPQSPPTKSSLQKVLLSSEAFHFCFTQCLSTEVEEVMGLLIGSVDDKSGLCHVTHCLPLKRLDKRKDRVEIGTEQLASSFAVVEELTAYRQQHAGDSSDQKFLGQLQVVGWYHSHPHITVFPSDVDIATHHQYQSTMSPFWLGLIFGVFNYEDARALNRFQLIAFQSVEAAAAANRRGGGRAGLHHMVVPISIEPRSSPTFDQWALKKASMLIDLLLEEEKEAFLIHQGTGNAPVGEQMGRQYNACVYSKAVAKIIALLGAPTVDVLKERREVANRLMKCAVGNRND